MSNPSHLRAELAAARSRVSGKTFAEAPELFKDIESIKVRMNRARQPRRAASKVDAE